LDLEEIVGDGGAAETRDVVGELAEGGPFAFGIGFGVDVAGHGGVLELGPEEEFVSNAMSAMNAMREVVRVASCVFRDLIVSVLDCTGAEVSASSPRRLQGMNWRNWEAWYWRSQSRKPPCFHSERFCLVMGRLSNSAGEDGFDFGEGVEPRKDGFVGLMVVKTEIELIADGVRETGDFADTSCSVHNILF